MAENEKLHNILEIIIHSGKDILNTQIIASSFTPPMTISECNMLCRKLANEGDVKVLPNNDDDARAGTISVIKITQTSDAYNTQKYLKADDIKPDNRKAEQYIFHAPVQNFNKDSFNPNSGVQSVDLRPALNPIEKPAIKNRINIATIIQKAFVWIISNLWQFLMLVGAAVLATYLIYKFAIPH